MAAEGTSVKISSDGDLAVPQDLHGYAVPRSQPQVRPHAWYIRPGREHPCTRPGLQAGSPATLTGWLRAWLFIRVAEHLLGRRCGKVNPDAEIPVLSRPPNNVGPSIEESEFECGFVLAHLAYRLVLCQPDIQGEPVAPMGK